MISVITIQKRATARTWHCTAQQKYMHRLEFHRQRKLCQLVVNLGVELRESGVNDAKTSESDIRPYLFMSKVHLLVSQMNNLIQSKCTEYTG